MIGEALPAATRNWTAISNALRVTVRKERNTSDIRHSGMDCRNPEAKDGEASYVLVTWTPAFLAG
jgi:hypothetical protein